MNGGGWGWNLSQPCHARLNMEEASLKETGEWVEAYRQCEVTSQKQEKSISIRKEWQTASKIYRGKQCEEIKPATWMLTITLI